jgi:hypothetical protein
LGGLSNGGWCGALRVAQHQAPLRGEVLGELGGGLPGEAGVRAFGVVVDVPERVVGQGAPVDPQIEDLAAGLEGRPYGLGQMGGAWMLRRRTAYAPLVRAAADVGARGLNLSEYDLSVLAAIAFHQPISRDLIGRLAGRPDRHWPARAKTRRAPYVCDDGILPCCLLDGNPSGSARLRATG